MYRYSLTHLSDPELLRNLADVVSRDRTTTATLLAHLAEVEARKLYVPAAYPSMRAYCVGELHMSEDVACDRIQAARKAREFPVLFAAIADGRLNLTGVLLLATALTPDNWPELLEAAEFKSKREIEQLLAVRSARGLGSELAPELPLASLGGAELPSENGTVAAERSVPERISAELSVPERITPTPTGFPLHAVLDQETQDMLAHAMSLLSHQVPSGDVGQVLRKLLEIAIPRLEKRKFGASSHPHASRQASTDPHHVPAHVRNAVWDRDGGQCTFVSEAGKRCASRRMLEFDHAIEVARGGASTVENVRLRCRAHNQYTAEQTFGAGFMRKKREVARREHAAKRPAMGDGDREAVEEENDVVPWLRQLGYRADRARHAARHCDAPPDATLEERVKAALRYLSPPNRRVGATS